MGGKSITNFESDAPDGDWNSYGIDMAKMFFTTTENDGSVGNSADA